MHSGIADGVLELGYPKGGPTYGWVAGFWKGGGAAETQALNECRGINKYNNQIRQNPQDSTPICAVFLDGIVRVVELASEVMAASPSSPPLCRGRGTPSDRAKIAPTRLRSS
jgi:hypothetical protein